MKAVLPINPGIKANFSRNKIFVVHLYGGVGVTTHFVPRIIKALVTTQNLTLIGVLVSISSVRSLASLVLTQRNLTHGT